MLYTTLGLLLTAEIASAAELHIGMEIDPNFENADSEAPQYNVTISKPFYLGKCEVTQAE